MKMMNHWRIASSKEGEFVYFALSERAEWVHECDDFTTTYNFRAIFRVEKEV